MTDSPTMATQARACVRRLNGLDGARYRQYLAALNDETRPAGFASAERTTGGALPVSALVLGAFDGHDVVGVGELHRLADRRAAEAVLSVAPADRTRGIALALFRQLVTCARNRGVRRLGVLTDPGNISALATSRRARGRLTLEGGQLRLDVVLPLPTPFSLAAEGLDGLAAARDALWSPWFDAAGPAEGAGPRRVP